MGAVPVLVGSQWNGKLVLDDEQGKELFIDLCRVGNVGPLAGSRIGTEAQRYVPWVLARLIPNKNRG